MKVDQFESIFRAAAKEPYQYQRVEFARVLVITDLEGESAQTFIGDAKSFLGLLGDTVNWSVLEDSDFSGVESLLDKVKEANPDLIVTYRNLRSEAWKWPYTLGEHLDVLTQIADAPVLVAPHPSAGRASGHSMQTTNLVMAVTDHLTGDHRLVNVAARLTSPDGSLLLAHIEDEQTFDRYIKTISKIGSIETESAKETIGRQLLKEPSDYIQSCGDVLKENALTITVQSHVGMGHHLAEYRRLMKEKQIDLLVMNTKDEDQLAMHGLAYPLAVGLREIPLLLL